jgi:hypothetical protein
MIIDSGSSACVTGGRSDLDPLALTTVSQIAVEKISRFPCGDLALLTAPKRQRVSQIQR